MGDEAFFAFLQMYYAENAGRIANGDEFLNMLQNSTKIDLSGVIAEYFR
jgi:aminopeptidase N